MGGRSSSFRKSKSEGTKPAKSDGSKGLSGMTYYNAHTTTYDQWKKRNEEYMQAFVPKQQAYRKMTNKEIDAQAKSEQSRDPIAVRYNQLKDQHPEWKTPLQGKSWIRKHDKYGQEAERLRKQGLAPFQIVHKLFDKRR